MHHCRCLRKHVVNKFMYLDLVVKMRNTFVSQYININAYTTCVADLEYNEGSDEYEDNDDE